MKKIATILAVTAFAVHAFADNAATQTIRVGEEAARSLPRVGAPVAPAAGKINGPALSAEGASAVNAGALGTAGKKQKNSESILLKSSKAVFAAEKLGGSCAVDGVITQLSETTKRNLAMLVKAKIIGDACLSHFDKETAERAIDQVGMDGYSAMRSFGVESTDELNLDQQLVVINAMGARLNKSIGVTDGTHRLGQTIANKCDLIGFGGESLMGKIL